MVNVLMWAILILVGIASVRADELARWSYSAYSADIIFRVVDETSAPKWYIGECAGDIAPLSGRIKLYETTRRGLGITKVQLTSLKHQADRIFCVKDHDSVK
ncbi:hypothetical protein GCM10017044_03170 [Kordiimonas sediminis]|uniref:Uncharacterized protein n=1 Tax=Kordiimonas sediminis TaxID=1735581 RepID=A0A919E4L9_9PROT|nr:hypothetical protein [Kordiimonas sediminis]GHF12573.1 hypothetical protein GCM10017044_03170 [Kordiimonas sediminis]